MGLGGLIVVVVVIAAILGNKGAQEFLKGMTIVVLVMLGLIYVAANQYGDVNTKQRDWIGNSRDGGWRMNDGCDQRYQNCN